MKPSSFAFFSVYFTIVYALKPAQECFESISEAYGDLTFVGDDPLDYYGSLCQNPLKTCSMYASGELFCSSREIEAGISVVREYCKEYGLVPLMPMNNCTGNFSISEDVIQTYPTVDTDMIYAGQNISEMTVLSQNFFGATLRTVSTWDYEELKHTTYGWASYGFWGGILLIGMLNNLINTVWHIRAGRTLEDLEGAGARSNGLSSSLWHWFQSNAVIPSVLGTYHRRLFWSCSIPTRLEAFVIWAFWAISIVLCAVNIRTFEGNLYWATIPPQVWRYLADRTGIICYSNLPLLWMFSGRNNIFLWATGWDFGTFNLFHKHIARVATLEAIIHSIAYTVIMLQEDGDYAEEMAQSWCYLGVVAVVSMSLLLLFSSIWLRRKMYELFLVIHIALAVLIIVCLFKHTSIFDGEYNGYLWPLVAIWSVDRFLRIVRQVYCNVRVAFDKKGLRVSKSVAFYDIDANVIKLTVTPAHTLLKPAAGQFYYIYRPVSWKGWENHPFTLASWGSQPSSETGVSENAFTKDILVSESIATRPNTFASSCSSTEVSSNNEQQLIFWLRPYDGWTRRLRDLCKKSPDGTSRSWIMIEGPYGHHIKLYSYDTVLLIAGGTGLSAALPHIEEHIRRNSQNSGADKKPPRTRSIEMVWACKQPAFIHDVCAQELKPALARDDIRMQFYSTSVAHSKSTSAEVDKIETDSTGTIEVAINQGRPDIMATILDAAKENIESGTRAGRLAILVCGPAEMADEARAAVHRAMKDGCRNIEFFEETFGW